MPSRPWPLSVTPARRSPRNGGDCSVRRVGLSEASVRTRRSLGVPARYRSCHIGDRQGVGRSRPGRGSASRDLESFRISGKQADAPRVPLGPGEAIWPPPRAHGTLGDLRRGSESRGSSSRKVQLPMQWELCGARRQRLRRGLRLPPSHKWPWVRPPRLPPASGEIRPEGRPTGRPGGRRG